LSIDAIFLIFPRNTGVDWGGGLDGLTVFLVVRLNGVDSLAVLSLDGLTVQNTGVAVTGVVQVV